MDINTETPSVAESSTTTTATDAGNTPVTTAPDASTPVVEEVFTPNYKYKAYGKEYEIDEWARPLLNKETQPHLTKLFEKAGGFEPLKERYTSLESEFGTYKNAYTELDGARNQILSMVEKKDLAGLGKMLGLSSEDFKNYVRQQLQYEGLPPEQKQAVDRQNQLEQQQLMLKQQNMAVQQYAQEIMMQKHEIEVMHAFSSPKYSSAISAYNFRVGDENAFRSVVDKIGAYEFTVNGRNMPVAEAVEQAIQLLGLGHGVEVQGGPTAANPATPAAAQNRPQPKPIVVPNGSSAAPVKKSVSTWEDLKRAQQEAFN